MSGGGGGGLGPLVRRAYDQLPNNMGGTGSYPGMDTQQQQPAQGGSWASPQYGQLGSYNTLAQDMSMQRTGPFQFGGGMPFGYTPGMQSGGGRPGISGYTGVGPFQNQGGGQLPGGMQGSLGYSPWPGFGQGGAPHYQPHSYPPGQFGGGFFGGGGFGNQGFGNFGFGGPGSYQSPGSMQYGGGSGFYSGGSPFMRQQRRQDVAQQLRGRTTPFGGVSNRHPLGSFLRLPGQMPGGGAMTTGSDQAGLAAAAMAGRGGNLQQITGGPRTVQPAQQVEQFLNYRSPFSGGGRFTQYGPDKGQQPWAGQGIGQPALW